VKDFIFIFGFYLLNFLRFYPLLSAQFIFNYSILGVIMAIAHHPRMGWFLACGLLWSPLFAKGDGFFVSFPSFRIF
jgi:hypothetical protein